MQNDGTPSTVYSYKNSTFIKYLSGCTIILNVYHYYQGSRIMSVLDEATNQISPEVNAVIGIAIANNITSTIMHKK
jgi:hypothetical protein